LHFEGEIRWLKEWYGELEIGFVGLETENYCLNDTFTAGYLKFLNITFSLPWFG